MQDLSVTQQYYICTVNRKGKIPGFGMEKRVCFVAAGLLELQLEDVIELDGKKASVCAPLPAKLNYLSPLYQFIEEHSPVKVEKILEEYHYKRLNKLMEAVGQSLEEAGCAQAAKAGFFSGQTGYIPHKEVISRVINLMRTELLEDGEITEDVVALAILLEKSKSLKLYFSAFEQKELKGKLKEIMQSPAGKQVKAMLEYVETMIAVMIVLVAGY